jgi:hypothetical protein
MEPRTVARMLTLGRVAIGAALIAAPVRAAAGWLGPAAERPETQVVLAALGARDIVLGVGGAVTAEGHGSARPWLVAAALSDLADLAATLRHRDALPLTGVVGVGALAAGAAAAGLWVATELD